jgi:hypothetical protein
MTHPTNINEDTCLVLVRELITALERQRKANGQPSLVTQLSTAIAQAGTDYAQGAEAQLVLEGVEQTVKTPRGRDLHFGDLVAGLPGMGQTKAA